MHNLTISSVNVKNIHNTSFCIEGTQLPQFVAYDEFEDLHVIFRNLSVLCSLVFDVLLLHCDAYISFCIKSSLL